MTPFLSFIIPVFNGESTIKQCLKSIETINYPKNKIEIIVVDNNSTDSTVQILNQFKIILVKEIKQGRSYARNKGASIAQGELLAFIDSDCVLDKNWAKELIQSFQFPFIGAAQGAIVPSGVTKNSLDQFRYRRVRNYTKGSFIVLDILASNFPAINSAAFMIRKKVFDQINGFDPQMLRHEDADIAKRVFIQGFGLASEIKAKAYVYWHGGTWKSYIERSWDMGKSLSLYQLKWSSSRWVTLFQFWIYYIKRFLDIKFFNKNLIIDIFVTLLLENLHMLSFHLSLLTKKKILNQCFKLTNSKEFAMTFKIGSDKLHTNPDYSIALLTNKIILYNVKEISLLVLEGTHFDFMYSMLKNIEVKSHLENFKNFIYQLTENGFLIKDNKLEHDEKA